MEGKPDVGNVMPKVIYPNGSTLYPKKPEAPVKRRFILSIITF
jgi:hypothetical protein